MSNKTRIKKREKKIFHKPEMNGVAKKIPATKRNTSLSIAGLMLAIGLICFSTYAVVYPYQGEMAGIIHLTGSYRLIFVFFAVLDVVVVVGFRIACKIIPLEMWRMPEKTRKGVIKTEGVLLKMATLLLELETTICFWYITVSLYLGYSPSDPVVLAWVVILVLTVYLFGKKAGEEAERRTVD